MQAWLRDYIHSCQCCFPSTSSPRELDACPSALRASVRASGRRSPRIAFGAELDDNDARTSRTHGRRGSTVRGRGRDLKAVEVRREYSSQLRSVSSRRSVPFAAAGVEWRRHSSGGDCGPHRHAADRSAQLSDGRHCDPPARWLPSRPLRHYRTRSDRHPPQQAATRAAHLRLVAARVHRRVRTWVGTRRQHCCVSRPPPFQAHGPTRTHTTSPRRIVTSAS